MILKINHDSLVRFLQSLDEYKISPKKLFLSSISVYGENYSRKYYYEDSQVNPVSPYTKTKLLAENF